MAQSKVVVLIVGQVYYVIIPIVAQVLSQDTEPVPVTDLFKNLVKAGMLDGQVGHASRVEKPALKIPNLTLTPATLRQ